jgi:hypothetical protein
MRYKGVRAPFAMVLQRICRPLYFLVADESTAVGDYSGRLNRYKRKLAVESSTVKIYSGRLNRYKKVSGQIVRCKNL